MKNDIEEQIQETVPPELRARVLQRAEPSLERNRLREESRAGEPWWSFFSRPLTLGGLAAAGAAVAVVFFVSQPKGGELKVAASPMEYDLEMLADAELLQDLDVLDKWQELRKEWKPKKT